MNTFWNGRPCIATRVRAIVGPAFLSTYWHAGLEGTERAAVEVLVDGSDPFYLDDADGSGWYKVTTGRGSPAIYHRELPVTGVIGGKL